MQHSRTTVLAAVLALAASLPAQEPRPQANPPSAEEQLKLTMPGAEHEELARYAGIWDVAIRMGSGTAAVNYQGTSENRTKVGGRFLQIEYQARGEAASTEGIFTLGFDPRHRRHTLIAMDSFGAYFVTSQGRRNENSPRIRMLGTDDDPMMKALGYTKEFVHVLDLRAPDEFAVEVWFIDTRTPARREFKYMEYTFTRKTQE